MFGRSHSRSCSALLAMRLPERVASGALFCRRRAEIRRLHFVRGLSKREISRRTGLTRKRSSGAEQ
jgi:hypothetical protein